MLSGLVFFVELTLGRTTLQMLASGKKVNNIKEGNHATYLNISWLPPFQETSSNTWLCLTRPHRSRLKESERGYPRISLGAVSPAEAPWLRSGRWMIKSQSLGAQANGDLIVIKHVQHIQACSHIWGIASFLSFYCLSNCPDLICNSPCNLKCVWRKSIWCKIIFWHARWIVDWLGNKDYGTTLWPMIQIKLFNFSCPDPILRCHHLLPCLDGPSYSGDSVMSVGWCLSWMSLDAKCSKRTICTFNPFPSQTPKC